MLTGSPVRAHLAVTALLTLSMSGCSFLFVQPPKDDYPARGYTMNCTTSPVAPVFDTIFTLTNLLSAGYVAQEDNVTNKGTAVTAGLLVAGAWLSSAIYGYYNTSRCSELMNEDDSPPYRRPVHYQPRPTWRPAPVAAPPPPPPASAPAAEPAVAAPAQPRVQQQQDDDDGSPARRQPDSDDPTTGQPRTGGTPRPDLNPRFGN